jgi:dethiobiotin synthetase
LVEPRLSGDISQQRVASSSQAKGLFLAGTDTGVGKTTVACGLIRLLAIRGFHPVPFKPVETGADPAPQDAAALLAAANRPDLPLDVVCPIPLRRPVAPAAAAVAEGVDTSLPVLSRHFAHAAAQGDVIVVESAGGLLTPYAAGVAGADLAAAFQLPLLLVARNSLGTVNHTALALAEIRRRRLPLLGLILVNTAAIPYPHDLSNAAQIADLTGIKSLGTLPFLPNPTPSLLADALQASVDLRPLWDVLAI